MGDFQEYCSKLENTWTWILSSRNYEGMMLVNVFNNGS